VEVTLPSGFTFTGVESVLFIYWLQVQDCIPCVKASIAVKNDSTVTVSLEGIPVAASQFVDLFKGPVKRLSEIVNLIARVKSWIDSVESRPLKLSIQMAVSCLENGLESMDEESDEYRKISFLIEQIKLV